ncbi:MAG: hypothetical protein AVDCRST_MAG04-3668, partial [uncultured Acetobacteraceae bacterium]
GGAPVERRDLRGRGHRHAVGGSVGRGAAPSKLHARRAEARCRWLAGSEI